MERLIKDLHNQLIYLPRALILFPIIVFAYLFIKDNDLKAIKGKLLKVAKKYG